MRLVRRLIGEHDFRVAGQFNRAGPLRQIGKDDTAQLDIVFRRYSYLGMNFERAPALAKFGFSLSKYGFIIFRWYQRGLKSAGAECAILHIAQIKEGSGAIAGAVFTPARHRQVAPTAVTTAGMSNCHMIVAIGKKMDLRRARAG